MDMADDIIKSESFVALFDILGFSDLVKDNESLCVNIPETPLLC